MAFVWKRAAVIAAGIKGRRKAAMTAYAARQRPITLARVAWLDRPITPRDPGRGLRQAVSAARTQNNDAGEHKGYMQLDPKWSNLSRINASELPRSRSRLCGQDPSCLPSHAYLDRQ